MISRFAALLAPIASRIAPAILSILALVCFVVAAFLAFGLPLGLCAIGAALFLAEWRMIEPRLAPGQRSPGGGR